MGSVQGGKRVLQVQCLCLQAHGSRVEAFEHKLTKIKVVGCSEIVLINDDIALAQSFLPDLQILLATSKTALSTINTF